MESHPLGLSQCNVPKVASYEFFTYFPVMFRDSLNSAYGVTLPLWFSAFSPLRRSLSPHRPVRRVCQLHCGPGDSLMLIHINRLSPWCTDHLHRDPPELHATLFSLAFNGETLLLDSSSCSLQHHVRYQRIMALCVIMCTQPVALPYSFIIMHSVYAKK